MTTAVDLRSGAVPAEATAPLAAFLKARDILIAGGGPRLGLVTQLDVDDAGLAHAIAGFHDYFTPP